jgi:excisionase family DNA binding protein
MDKETLTTAEAGRELGVSPSRIRQLVLAGRIEAERRGRDLFVTRESLERERVRKTGRPRKTGDGN